MENTKPLKPSPGLQSCPCCGWILTATKTGKVRKHGRAQTGNEGRRCAGSGQVAEIYYAPGFGPAV